MTGSFILREREREIGVGEERLYCKWGLYIAH